MGLEGEQSSLKALDICFEISNILNTGLDRQELELVAKLVQGGENPEVPPDC